MCDKEPTASEALDNPGCRSASIVDAIAVADIEPIPGAVLPDRVLDEPGKSLRKRWIELPGIDPLSRGLNYLSAAAGPVASHAVQNASHLDPLQDPSPGSKVMNQRVDGDHAAADLGPGDHFLGSAEQDGLDRAMARTLS